MTIVHKRIIYFIFIAIFVGIAPFLILYASGYRYNSALGILQKTGAINFDSNPENADIWINGERFKNRTPTIVTNLLPQEYDITVSRKGYIDWQRNINVRASEALFLNSIQLFKKDSFPMFIETLPEDVMFEYATSSTVVVNNFEYLIEGNGVSDAVVEYNRLSRATSSLAVLPHSEYEFVESPRDVLMLKDVTHHTVHVLVLSRDRRSVEKHHILPRVEGFDWNASGNQLLYYSQFELSSLDIYSGTHTLITRLSSGIQHAHWHPSGAYIIYQNGTKVNIVENIDEIDRQHFTILDMPNISDMAINKDGDQLYVYAVVGNQEGWFELEIQ